MVDRALILPHLLNQRAADDPDRICLENVSGERLSYRDLNDNVLAWAGALRRIGVAAGDTVLIMLPTSFTATYAWLGVAWLRALEVPVNTAYVGPMLRHVIRLCGARTMVVAERYLPRLREVADCLDGLQALVVPDATGPVGGFAFPVLTGAEFLPVVAAPFDDLPGPEHYDTGSVIFTSGTTGPSKGVPQSWSHMFQQATATWPLDDSMGRDDVIYAPFSSFHASGKAPLYLGVYLDAKVVMREAFSTHDFWRDINTYSCTTMVLIGSMANFLYQQAPSPDDAKNTLTNVNLTPLVPFGREFAERFGCRICTVYSQTELSIPIASGWNPTNTKSSGVVRAGYQVRVVNEHDEPMPPGRLGELVVRADDPWTLTSGYLGMPEATVASWRNQWVHTGDGFMYDEDGQFYFVDRLKDAIRRRGENISSVEVESLVNEHPDILESAAFGLPSEVGDEDVKIAVVLKRKRELRPSELFDYLISVMPHFMVPRYIEFVDDLPRTATGRVKKADLRSQGLTSDTWDRESTGVRVKRGS